MSLARTRTIRILSGCSMAFGVAAIVCAVVLYFSPKQGIAVLAILSLAGCVAMSVIGIVLGILSVIVSAGNSRLAFVGLLTCAIPLLYLLVTFWSDGRAQLGKGPQADSSGVQLKFNISQSYVPSEPPEITIDIRSDSIKSTRTRHDISEIVMPYG